MIASATLSFAQDVSSKLTPSTLIFIQQRDSKVDLTQRSTQQTQTEKQLGLIPMGRRNDQYIANPETHDGKQYISCFLRLKDNNELSGVEQKGVIIQCKFQKGLVTALVPVDSIESLAGLANVSRINVATKMKPTTDAAREATNVDDILTNSADAVAKGLSTKYDGKGVVLGVIDTGIDFQHIAFKDSKGNYRIKRAYVYDGSSAEEYTTLSSSAPTTDDSSEDHGTHTSSAAGGSSVIFSGTPGSSSYGSTVTVTDDHANATYGGMAPGADLYLAGINGLSSTYLANAFQKICDYADEVGEPCVVSNSWGGQYGPHDGTGDIADVIAQYFGDSHPNHICLFAASNDAGHAKDGEGGGYYIGGTASSSSPLGAVLRSGSYSNTDAGYYYSGILANAWTHSSYSGKLGVKVLVLDASTGAVKKTYSATQGSSKSSTITLSSTYYKGESSSSSWWGSSSDPTITVYWNYVSSATGKKQIMLYTDGLTSQKTSSTEKSDGSTYYTSNYTLAVQFYPTSGSIDMDAWSGSYTYYTDYLTTSGYTWAKGSDRSSVSDEACDPNVIAIGAYSTKNKVVDHNGTTQTLSYTVGDIAYFSSYQTEGSGATGALLPWISAPGATVVSAVNHYDTDGDYSYVNDNAAQYGMYRVNASTTNPYGSMEGTSMATPVAAGIVALWLQAAKDSKKAEYADGLTINEVKDIMKETAITDTWTTTGSNADHFGNGKIDALAGIKYILGTEDSGTDEPEEPEATSFDVTVSSYGLSTLYYDKALDIPDDEDLLGVYYAYAVNDEGEGTYDIRLKRITDIIPANTGVLIQANKGTYTFPISSESVDAISGNYLKGVTTATAVSDLSDNVWTLGSSSLGYVAFAKYTGTTIPANKAYLAFPYSTNAKSMTASIDNGTTGVQHLMVNGAKSAVWYTLQGVRLTKKPTVAGAYILNNKVVIVK